MKKIMSLALAALMLFALAACGGGTSSSEAASQPESVVNDDSSAAPEANGDENGEPAADDSLQKVLDAGELVMLTEATFPPYEFMQNVAEGAVIVDGYTGVDVELAYMIAQELGVELKIVDMNFDLLTESLKNGKGDIVAAGMSITEERLESIDFSIPYVDTDLSVVVPADSDITLADLDGLKISVQENTTSDILLSDPEGYELGFTPGEMARFKSAMDAGNAVAQGNADAMVIDLLTAESIVANSGGKLKMLDDSVAHEQYAMGLAKGSDALAEVVNKVLGEAFADGTVDTLIEKYMEISKED